MKIIRCALIFFILCFFSIFSFECYAANLRIHFIDVGEGDSAFIETPSGENILVDAGNIITGLKVVEHLKKNNIQNLDHLIFTHHDLDHIGGAFCLAQMIKVKKIYDNGQDLAKFTRSQVIYRWYEQLIRENSKYSVLKAKDSFLFDDVILKVLWPYHPFIFSDFNSNSLVVMVQYRKFRCLLTGDLTAPGEEALLEAISDVKADVLKVGHHGSDDASHPEFLKMVSPAVAVISVDRYNIYGRPQKEVLIRLKERGAKVYRTDRDGNIIITVKDDGSYTIETGR